MCVKSYEIILQGERNEQKNEDKSTEYAIIPHKECI